MANLKDSVNELLAIDGTLVSAIVDSNSGMVLSHAGSGIDIELAAAGNTEVMRAKLKTMHMLGLGDQIDDILITLAKQYHIIRPMSKNEGLFIYLVLDKARSNLALARRKAQDIEASIVV